MNIYFYIVRIYLSLDIFTAIFCLNPHIIRGDMKENVSVFFWTQCTFTEFQHHNILTWCSLIHYWKGSRWCNARTAGIEARRWYEACLSFPYDTIAVKVDGDDLSLSVELHLDIACCLQWVTLALSTHQHPSSHCSVLLVLSECELELAWFHQRALQHDIVDETCIAAHSYTSLSLSHCK